MGRREPVIPVLRRIAAGRHLKQAKPDDGPPSSAAVSTPRKAEIPITFLGCVYYPWKQLGPIPWLKILTLVNPLVYVSEGLRAAMTPSLPHMPVAAVLVALVAITAALAWLRIRSFVRRVTG